MAKLFELRPQKDLLNPMFEGYKLSLDSLPVYKHDLPNGVEHRKPNDQQLSFQHVKTFGLHNHLIDDPWEDEIAYFISQDFQVFQINIHSLASLNPQFLSVLQIPKNSENLDGWFNSSLSFAGSNLATVTDGGGTLYILDTKSRSSVNCMPWQIKLSHQPPGLTGPFKIMHSYLNEDPCSSNAGILSILLLQVKAIDEIESQIALSKFGCNDKETPFITCLEWVEYRQIEGVWSFFKLKRLAIPYGLDYASVLSPGNSLCLIAREPFGIIYDSVKNCATPLEASQTLTEMDKIRYTWAETPQEVMLWMIFEKHTSKHDLVIEIKQQNLKIVHKNQTYLDGELAHNVVVDSSTWSISDGQLEVILTKANQSQDWDHLVHGCLRGQKVVDAEAAAEWHHRLVHIASQDMQPGAVGSRPPIFSSEQLEECDDVPLDDTYLFRFAGETNEITHKAVLSGYQLLFTTRSVPGLSPAFCLRHNVDGLVWQPMGDEVEQPWGCLNTSVLQALGYIQASKEQRKFTVAPPNMSYAALCDAFTHVYIYRQPNGSSTGVELVHRPTGRKVGNIARQQVLNIDTPEECLGALATNTFLLILTSSSLFCVRINSD